MNDDDTPGTRHEPLDAREIEIVRLLAQGMSAKEVARHLGISARLVERGIEVIRAKTGARNSTHMVARAVQQGWI